VVTKYTTRHYTLTASLHYHVKYKFSKISKPIMTKNTRLCKNIYCRSDFLLLSIDEWRRLQAVVQNTEAYIEHLFK